MRSYKKKAFASGKRFCLMFYWTSKNTIQYLKLNFLNGWMIKNLLKFNELVLEKLVNWMSYMFYSKQQKLSFEYGITALYLSQKLFFPNVEDVSRTRIWYP
jgi:hypothetical protein